MAKSPKSFLLEQLRAQADAVAAKRVQQLKLSREVVDRLESVILDLKTPALDTRALDDLVNLMLVKPSQFLLRAPLRGFVR